MAIQTGKLRFTGKLGDELIGYYRNGKHCLRSMPQQVKQTAATKAASARFGAASRKGKLIREPFAPYLRGKKDSAYVNRLNKHLISADVQDLHGFQFNQHTSARNFVVNAQLGADNTLRISQLMRPNHTKVTHMEIRVIATLIDFESGKVINTISRAYMHDVKTSMDDFKGIELDANVPGKGTLIVALQINPYQGKYPLYDQRYYGTDIIAVKVPVAKTIRSKKQRRQQQPNQKATQQWQHFGNREWLLPEPDSILASNHHLPHNTLLKEKRE